MLNSIFVSFVNNIPPKFKSSKGRIQTAMEKSPNTYSNSKKEQYDFMLEDLLDNIQETPMSQLED